MGIKADIEIAKRCYDFLIKKYGKVSKVCHNTRIKRATIEVWRDGNAVPSAYFLQYLTELGADPKYLLTGKFMADIKTDEAKESRDDLIDDFVKSLKKELATVIVRRDIHDNETTDLDSDDVWEKIDEIAERLKGRREKI